MAGLGTARRWIAAVLLLAGLAAAVPAFADDKDVLTRFLESNLSGAGRVVTITGFQGALSSQAKIAELTVADDKGVWLALKDVVLDWDQGALLGGALKVNKLSAAEIDLSRMPEAQPAAPSLPKPEAKPFSFSLPDLPVAIDIGEISAAKIIVGAPVLGQKVEGSLKANAGLVGGKGHISLALDRTDGVLGHLTLSAAYANDTKQLALAVEAEEAAGGLAVSALGLPGAPAAHLVIGGTGPLDDFTAKLKLDTDGVTRLAGQLVLKGDETGAMAFSAELSGNMAPLFAPDYATFFGDSMSLSAAGKRDADGRLELPDFHVSAKALTLQGSLVLAADGLPEQVAVTGSLGSADGAPVLLPISGVPTRVGLARLSVAYDQARGEGWTGSLTVSGLDRADFSAGKLSLTGQGQVRHGADAGLTAELGFEASGLKPADAALAQALGSTVTGKLALDWQAASDKLTVSDLNLAAGDATLTTQGTIGGLGGGLRLDGKLALSAKDLSRFAALAGRPLAGSADLALTGWVSPLSGQFDGDATVTGQDLHVGVAQLDGLLAGTSRIALSGRRDETGTTIRRLKVTAGGGLTADLTGQVASAGSELKGKVALDNLSALGLGLKGALTADADFTGRLEDGHLVLHGTGTDLAMGQAQADALGKGQTRLDLDLVLKGSRIEVNAVRLDGPSISASAKGVYDPAGSDLNVALSLPDLSVLQPGWTGSLHGTARLSGPTEAMKAEVTANSEGLALGQAMIDPLIGGTGSLSAALRVESGRLLLDHVDFSTAALKLTASGEPEDLQVSAELADLGAILPEFPGPLDVSGTVKQGTAGTMLDLAVKGPGQIDAKLAGTIAADQKAASLTVKGTAQAGLANVIISPRVMAGGLSFDLALNGPLSLNSLTGTVRLRDGRLADPDLPMLALTGMTADVRLAGGAAQVAAQARFKTGGGLKAEGRIGLTPPMPANLQITFQNAVLRDPALYQAQVNGQLTLTGPALGGGKLAGRLTLGRTELQIPSSGLTALPVLNGLKHVGDSPAARLTRQRAGMNGPAKQAAPAAASALGLDVTILAPNQLFIRGRGLDAELGGSLKLAGTTADIVPSGGFELVRGRLDLLGKRLTLTEASLKMRGSMIPYVHVAATTQSGDYAISVVIDGNALEPTVSFTSVPELPQEEVISRLIFDQGLQNLSAFQAAQLAAAVASLAGQGGEGMIGQIRKSAGLDNLDVRTDAQGNSSVTVGKYLTRKIYTQLTVDQTGKSTLELNLDVSRHVTLRGSVEDTGEAGIGVFLSRDY